MSGSDLHPFSGWHLKKEIQVGHIFTTLVVALSAVIYIHKIEERVKVLETLMVIQSQRDARQDANAEETIRLLRGQLEKISDKLDRIIESEMTFAPRTRKYEGR